MHMKAQIYLQAGTAEVWIVDPEQVLIEILTTHGTTVYRQHQQVISTILPGFPHTVHDLIP